MMNRSLAASVFGAVLFAALGQSAFADIISGGVDYKFGGVICTEDPVNGCAAAYGAMVMDNGDLFLNSAASDYPRVAPFSDVLVASPPPAPQVPTTTATSNWTPITGLCPPGCLAFGTLDTAETTGVVLLDHSIVEIRDTNGLHLVTAGNGFYYTMLEPNGSSVSDIILLGDLPTPGANGVITMASTPEPSAGLFLLSVLGVLAFLQYRSNCRMAP